MSWLVMQDNPGSSPGGVLVFDPDEAVKMADERRLALVRQHGHLVKVWLEPAKATPSLQPVKPTDNPPSPHERDA